MLETTRERKWKHTGDFLDVSYNRFGDICFGDIDDKMAKRLANSIMRKNFMNEANALSRGDHNVYVVVKLDLIKRHGLLMCNSVAGTRDCDTTLLENDFVFLNTDEGIEWCLKYGLRFEFKQFKDLNDSGAGDTSYALKA